MSKKEKATIIETSPLTEQIAEKMRQRLALKLRVKALDAEIKDTEEKLKSFMRENNYKIIATKGLRITHTPPRDYEVLTNQKVAYKFLRENRPDLIETRSGYERLTVKIE